MTTISEDEMADKKEELAKVFFECALYERQSTDWVEALDAFTEYVAKAGRESMLAELRAGGVEFDKELKEFMHQMVHGDFLADNPEDLKNALNLPNWIRSYGDRRAAPLQVQVNLLCAEIKKADKLLSEGKTAEALAAVRHLASISSASYLKYVSRATAAVPKWIPVSEQTPEVNTEVLICFYGKGLPSTGQYQRDGTWCYPRENYDGPDDNPAVSHWMPLPQPPKETL